jgi:hypothetical protein
VVRSADGNSDESGKPKARLAGPMTFRTLAGRAVPPLRAAPFVPTDELGGPRPSNQVRRRNSPPTKNGCTYPGQGGEL